MSVEAGDSSNLFELLSHEIAECNKAKGWYDASHSFGDMIALLHSEVSEMLEAFRVYGVGSFALYDYWTGLELAMPARVAAAVSAKPEGVGSEAADVLVRLLDLCSRYDIDLYAEVRRKIEYNWTRPYRHGGKRL